MLLERSIYQVRKKPNIMSGFLVVLLALSDLAGCERTDLEGNITAGNNAYQDGNYTEAEKLYFAALKEAEGFGPQDPRLATSLYNLALVYGNQGKYTEAEPLYRRSLAIREKALGAEHLDVAHSLNNLALLYNNGTCQ